MKLAKVAIHFPPYRYTRKQFADDLAVASRIGHAERVALGATLERGRESVTYRVVGNAAATGKHLHREHALKMCCEVVGKFILHDGDLDNLIVCTSSGMLIPGLAQQVAEGAKFSGLIRTLDIVGAGCGAFFDVLRVLPAFPGTTLVVFVEVQSALQSFPADVGRLIVGSFCSDAAAACLFFDHGTYAVRGLKSELCAAEGYLYDGEKAVFSSNGEVASLPGEPRDDFYCAASSDFVLDKLVAKFPHLNFDTADQILRSHGNCGSVGTVLALQQAIADGSKEFSLASWGPGKTSICTLTHES